MADINRAVEEVYKSKLFCDMCRRYGGNNHEDLKSEVMLMILEMPVDKKQNIVDAGYLLPYCIQMARFQATGRYTNKRFLKLFHDQKIIYTDQVPEINIEEYDHEIDEMANKMGEILKQDSLDQSNEFFYHSRLLLETLKYRSVKQTAKAIGIPYNSVRRSLTDYKNSLIVCSESQQ